MVISSGWVGLAIFFFSILFLLAPTGFLFEGIPESFMRCFFVLEARFLFLFSVQMVLAQLG